MPLGRAQAVQSEAALDAMADTVTPQGIVAAFDGVARPIDCDLQHPWEFGLRILSLHPPVVSAEPVPSTIGGGKPRSRNPWPKLRYEARRLWPRWRHFSRLYGPLFWLRWRRGTACPPTDDRA